MIVEPYSDKYFLDVVKLVESFHREAVAEYDQLFDAQTIIDTIKAHKDAETAFLLIIDGSCQGILFGVETKSLLNGSKVFQEIIWYVNKSHRGFGLALFREAEKLLKLKNFKTIIMAVLENSKTQKLKAFYERLGFKPMETHYVRTL